MKIGNSSVAELPPQLKRGGDFDAQREELQQMAAPRGGRPNDKKLLDDEDFDFKGTSRK